MTATVKSGGDAGTVPEAKTEPKLKGKAEVGSTLTVTRGVWTNDPTAYHYRWLVCGDRCRHLAHVTTRYTLKPSDLGKVVIVEVLAVNKSGKGIGGAGKGPVRKKGARGGSGGGTVGVVFFLNRKVSEARSLHRSAQSERIHQIS